MVRCSRYQARVPVKAHNRCRLLKKTRSSKRIAARGGALGMAGKTKKLRMAKKLMKLRGSKSMRL